LRGRAPELPGLGLRGGGREGERERREGGGEERRGAHRRDATVAVNPRPAPRGAPATSPICLVCLASSLRSVVLLSAGGLTACGGGEEGAAEVLEQTFAGQGERFDSGRLAVGLRLTPTGDRGQGSLGSLSARLEGPFVAAEGDDGVPRFDLELSLDAGPASRSAGLVSTGDALFVRAQGQTVQLPDAQFQEFARGVREGGEEGGGTTLASLGIDPRGWLTDPRRVGGEEIAGTETIHVRAGIDVARLLADVDRLLAQAARLGVGEGQAPRSLTPQQRELITQAVRSARMDVWTGEDDKVLRRLRVEVGYAVPEQARQQVGLGRGTLALELGVSELNEDQEIEAPRNAMRAPAAPGGGGTQGGGQLGSPEYNRCLQQAGDDIAAVQQCARLLD